VARGKSINAETLVALGAEPLANHLIEHAATDAGLRAKLGMLLAGAKGAGTLADEIDKRLRTIARSRSFNGWDKRKALVQELDHLRATIARRLAESDRPRAIELFWSFIAMADTLAQRVSDGAGDVEDFFGAAMADLGRLRGIERQGTGEPSRAASSPIATETVLAPPMG